MPPSRKPQSLGEILESVVDRLGIRQELDEADVIEAWASLAGPDVNAVTDGAWLRKRKLFVKITSPGRRQDLHLDRSNWRDRLNERLGADRIDEIVFR
ncbi:MAG: DUF721 domain-containing protein [Rhodothermales bacterium]